MLLSSYTSDLIEAGCDEVGRGCLAGPVVAAAVILPKNYQHALLNDSKQLTRQNRVDLQADTSNEYVKLALGLSTDERRCCVTHA